MVRSARRKFISIVLSAMIILSVFAVPAAVTANAAETAVSVNIASVTRKYKEAKTFLDKLNSYRKENNLTEFKMDSSLIEKAMVRAAELSVYASVNSPDGTNCVNSSIYDMGQLIGYDVYNASDLINSFKKNSTQKAVLDSDYMTTVGVGVVEVRSKKYICVITSNQKLSEVDSSVLTQANTTVKQPIKILPSLLNNCQMVYKDGQTVYCGTSIDVYVSVTNSTYTSSVAYLSSSSFNVTSSDPSIFAVQKDKTVKALSPGTSTITLTHSGMSSFKLTVKLTASSLKFSNCTVSDISDQVYTGSAIQPKPVIKSGSTTLVEGTDYTLSYSNNVLYGTGTITITGINKYTGQTMTKNFNIISDSTNFTVASTVSLNSMSIGQSLKIGASSVNGQSTVKYTYSYTTNRSSTTVNIKSSTTEKSCTFSPQTVGTYYIKVTATDSAGNTASVNKTVIVQPKVALTVILGTSELILNNTQSIKVGATGGVTPLTYACYVQLPGSTSWKTIKDYSSTSSFTYKPASVGKYQVCVKCRSASGYDTKVYKEFNVTRSTLENHSTISRTTIALGDSVKLTGVAEKGTGSYQYGYYYKLSTAENYSVIKKYGDSKTATFTPKAAGKYDICVKVMDSSITVEKKNFTLTVNNALKLEAKTSALVINLGATVNVTASSTGGSGNYTYAFYYKKTTDKNWVTKADFGSASSVTIKPAVDTTYDICVKVKDSAGSSAKVYLTLKVNPKLVNNSTVSSTSITKGTTVTAKAAAAGGAGGYTYAVYYKKAADKKWVTAQDFGTSTTATFKPAQAATYNVCIKVKDSSGAEAKKYIDIVVK